MRRKRSDKQTTDGYDSDGKRYLQVRPQIEGLQVCKINL